MDVKIEYEVMDESLDPVTESLDNTVFNDQYIELSEEFVEKYSIKQDLIDYPFVLPTLYSNHVAIPGRLLVYRIGFDGLSSVTEYGHLNGNLQVNRREIVCRVNRNIYQQGYQEVYRRWKNKLSQRYRTNIEAVSCIINNVVMTANKINNSTKIDYPVYVQRKLDGMRFTAYLDKDKVLIRSRQNNFFPYLDHIRTEMKDILQKLPEGYLLDGELYLHGKSFQAISSLLKSRLSEKSHEIKAYVFDLIDQERLSFADRLDILDKLSLERYIHVNLVDTYWIETREELDNLYYDSINRGYEGLMIRNPDSPYETKRTNALLKLKGRETDEAIILDVLSGKGTHSDLAIFRLKDSLGVITNVVPSGTHEKRREWLKNKKDIIGKRYQFEFQERIKKTNAPRHPVGLHFID